MEILGLDIGGSGIKGALVDVRKGELATERFRLPTPTMAKPVDVAEVVNGVVEHFNWSGPVGCGFPSIVRSGMIYSAANIDPSWIGINAESIFSQRCGNPFFVLNDADAAGIAEMSFGAGRNQKGVVFLLTLGTGIGSALFVDGKLVPNTELGHLKIRGKDAEARASDAVRQSKDLSWAKWAQRLQEYLQTLEDLFSPNLFIIGGGVSKKHDKFLPLLNINTEIVPATLLNEAGIVGAAMYAYQTSPKLG